MTTVSPVNQRGNAKAVHVDDMGFDGPVPAGAFTFYKTSDIEMAGLLFGCPCGCGSMMSVAIDAGSEGKRHRPKWQWDGNQVAPTLTPSILIYQQNDGGERIGEHWHGYLTAGEFVSC